MWPWKKRKIVIDNGEELIVCVKKDCAYWRQFTIYRTWGTVIWKKSGRGFDGMAGPVPCIFCSHFTRGDCYDNVIEDFTGNKVISTKNPF